MSVDLLPGVPLPRDVFLVVFRHLSQGGLCACLRVCKAFYHMITSDDVLLARIQTIYSFQQFKTYLEVGKLYYHAEYYTDIGQNDDAKFPYCEQFVVTDLSHRDEPEMHLSFSGVVAPGQQRSTSTGSMLFSERYMMEGTDIYGVNKMDVMLKLLEKIWGYVNDPNNIQGIFKMLPYLNTNMCKAIKKIKRHLKENPKFGEFAVLQAGHTLWFKKVCLRPEEEPDSSSDEELSQDVSEMNVGKVPVYFCKRCQWKVGGFTCQGQKKETCGELLVLQRDATLQCPKGCGMMEAPLCCRRRAMKAQVDSRYTISASSSQAGDMSWKTCPVFSCEKCSFGVNGIRCFVCSPSGEGVERNGFFERVWCAYVWTCPKACGRRNRGGLTHSGFIQCKCQADNATPMKVHDYIAKFGYPQN